MDDEEQLARYRDAIRNNPDLAVKVLDVVSAFPDTEVSQENQEAVNKLREMLEGFEKKADASTKTLPIT